MSDQKKLPAISLSLSDYLKEYNTASDSSFSYDVEAPSMGYAKNAAPKYDAAKHPCHIIRDLRFGYSKAWTGSDAKYVYFGGTLPDCMQKRLRSSPYLVWYGATYAIQSFLAASQCVEISYEEAMKRVELSSLFT